MLGRNKDDRKRHKKNQGRQRTDKALSALVSPGINRQLISVTPVGGPEEYALFTLH